MPGTTAYGFVGAGLRPHEQLLLELCRRETERRLGENGFSSLALADVGQRFFALAARHGVYGLALSTLEQPQLFSLLPPALARRIPPSLRSMRQQAILWDLERDRLLSQLASHDLIPLVLKGAALRPTLYVEPAQRQLVDIDILFPRERVDDALRALRALGYRNPWPEAALDAYRQHHFHIQLVNDQGYKVEVHWDLVRPGMPFRLDPAAFERRSQLCRQVRGPDLRVPSVEDTVLHMASQNLCGAFRLCRLVDVDRAVASSPRFDWDYLEQSAKAGKLEVMLSLTLRLCETQLGTQIPEGFIDRLRVPGAVLLHLALLQPARWSISSPPEHVTAARLRYLWCVSGWRARLRTIYQTLEGKDDPMKWIWKGEPDPTPKAEGALQGIAAVLKLAAYQVWLYARAAASPVSSAGREMMRGLWSTG